MTPPARALSDRLRALHGAAAKAPPPQVQDSDGGFHVHRATLSALLRRGAVEIDRDLLPSGAVWLDTETTGLAGGTGTQVFLIGVVARSEQGFLLEQFVLRRLGAERAMLVALGERLRAATRLVTYNGQRFDWPLLETRFRLQRVPEPWDEPPHLDLLPIGRRLWRGLLGTARLSAIEAEIFGVFRDRDIPGAEIPGRYAAYLRTKNETLLNPILDHNRADLLTLLAVHAVDATIASAGGSPVTVDDAGYGRHLELLGRGEAAVSVYRRALAGTPDAAVRHRLVTRLCSLLRRAGRSDETLAIWLHEAERGLLPAPEALRRAASVAERVLGDRALASALVDRALRSLERRLVYLGTAGAAELALAQRLQQIRKRLTVARGEPGLGTRVAFPMGSRHSW